MHRLISPALKMAPQLVRNCALRGEPFTVIDVGCSMGIDPVWQSVFGRALRACGIDPMVREIEKLARENISPNFTYHNAFIGLPASHPFKQKQAEEASQRIHDNAMSRKSVTALRRKIREQGQEPEFHRGNCNWPKQELTERSLTMAEFVRENKIEDVDFIKIDTDGGDLEAAISCEEIFQSHEVLGVVIENSFFGAFTSTENVFSNVDIYMRKQGFKLYNFTVIRNARAALPMPFLEPWPGANVSGPPSWGDFLYLRDPVDSEYSRHWDFDPSPGKLLKLICLFEMFGLPDCAAELTIERRDAISDRVDVTWLLDTLTPLLNGEALSYEDYVARFYSAPEAFFPQGPESRAEEGSYHRHVSDMAALTARFVKQDSCK